MEDPGRIVQDAGRIGEDDGEPYERLVEMIADELALAGEGRFDQLRQAASARAALTATLPATPPARAREPLSRALLMQERLTIELLRGRETLLLSLAQVERGRRTARGYDPPRRRRPQLDATA